MWIKQEDHRRERPSGFAELSRLLRLARTEPHVHRIGRLFGANMTLTGTGQASGLARTRSRRIFPGTGRVSDAGTRIPLGRRASGNRAVMLSNPLWQTRFGGDNNVVGRQVTLDGERIRLPA